MDAVLTTIKPIVQGLVEKELKTVIEQNIDKIDTIEPIVDAKLGEVAGKIKALIIDNINKIPFVPDSIKKEFISQIPVDKLIEIINGFDFEPFKATLLAIPTTGISDPTELNKIKTTLTGLPDKIKSLLIKHIESVFNGTAISVPAAPPAVMPSQSPAVMPPQPPAGMPSQPPAGMPPQPPTTNMSENIKSNFNNLLPNDQAKIINDIRQLLINIGIYNKIIENPVMSGGEPEQPNVAGGENPVVVAGGEEPVLIGGQESMVSGGEQPVVVSGGEQPLVVGGQESIVSGGEQPVGGQLVVYSRPKYNFSKRKTKKNIRHNRHF